MRRFFKSIFKKRQLIVSHMQYKLMVGNFLYLLAMVLVFVTGIIVPLALTLDDPSLSETQREETSRQVLALHGQLGIAVPLILALCVLHSLFVSHRIAGPLYRFIRIFKAVGEGDLSKPVRVRRGDYVSQEASGVDEMVSSLAGRIRSIRKSYEEVGSTLPRLIDALGRGDRRDSEVLVGQMGTRLDELGLQIRAFKLPESDVETRPSLPEVPAPARDSAPTVTI